MIRGQEFIYDNRWVVPFNAWVLRKFLAHINTEICISIRSLKYIFKYVYKGPDRAQLVIESDFSGAREPVDEIKEYLDVRYVGAAEGLFSPFLKG